MNASRRRKLIVATAVVLGVVGGGAALASSQFGSSNDESQAVVNDAAKQLGVSPSALSNALKQAVIHRVDAAVAAGRLTKAEGDVLKARIRSGSAPFFGFGDRPVGDHFAHGLAAAAAYLGLSEDQLRSQLESGKTLAAIAKAQGKSVDGLIDALYQAAKEDLDQAVADGRLTQAQEQTILPRVRDAITARVNGTMPQFGGGFGHFDRFGAPRVRPPWGGFDRLRDFRSATT